MNGADGIDARILAFVQERFPFARQRRVAREDSLLESGIVDSLGVLELVEFLERTFGISVTLTVVVTPKPFPEDVCACTTVSRVAGSINSFISRNPVIASFA